MPVEIVTQDDLLRFKQDLIKELLIEFKKITGYSNHGSKKWLRSKDLRAMLNISPNTLQKFRISGKLPCKKICGIWFYRYDDVISFFENNDQ
ncbi:MAG: hypothetical protein A2033_16065 [Bacteroidetes bacterium GWA2_31_9]|nr:MAG: hypothetical protein A2033_16065 [Bacteroidetes bacterium GWA2_31_9]